MAQSVIDRAGLQPRLLAAERLAEVLAGSPFEPLAAQDIADSRDRGLANRLLNVALRRHGHLNHVLAALLERGMPKKSGSFEPVLRLSLAQLLFLPEMGEHSALFLAGEAMKRDPRARHLAGLMNAVLRRAQAEAGRWRSLPLAGLFPDALAERWLKLYGAEALEVFGQALLDGAPLDLTLRDDDPALVEALGAERLVGDSVRLATRDRTVAELPGYAEGRWWVQDVAASLPARLLRLATGARVLDLCAAPGGKTAQLVKAGYRVTALDSDPSRMQRLEANLARLGYGAETVVADAGSFEPAERFDAVLLDAPCSATGIFRRHPEVVWHRDAADIAGRAELQQQLIGRAADMLKPGGVLVYCVCSLEPEEGKAHLLFVERNLPYLEPMPIGPEELAPLTGVVGPRGELRTHPGVDAGAPGGMDGFFAMRFRRT